MALLLEEELKLWDKEGTEHFDPDYEAGDAKDEKAMVSAAGNLDLSFESLEPDDGGVSKFDQLAKQDFGDLVRLGDSLAPISGCLISASRAKIVLGELANMHVTKETLKRSNDPVLVNVKLYKNHADVSVRVAAKSLAESWRHIFKEGAKNTRFPTAKSFEEGMAAPKNADIAETTSPGSAQRRRILGKTPSATSDS